MLGLLWSRRKTDVEHHASNGDIAKLFFDSFSKRVTGVEENTRAMFSEIEKLKSLIDRSQISDLVLLDRLKKLEVLAKESRDSIRTSVEKAHSSEEMATPGTRIRKADPYSGEASDSLARNERLIASQVLSPVGELGSLPSITTPTELQVLTLLANEGPKSAPDIGRVVGRSREHTSRLMKKLYQEGYLRRDQARIPFRYSLVEKVRQSFKKTGVKDEGEGPISVPQS